MATGAQRVNIYQKKFMSQQQAETNFMDYLKNAARELSSRVFPQSGLFQSVALTADTNDSFDIATPCEGMDDAGRQLVLPTGDQLNNNVSFENAAATVYSVGMKFNENFPVSVETNVKSGEPEYDLWEEVVGEVADPDTVQNITSPSLKLKITIDTVLKISGVNFTHAGRKAVVWLKNPVSPTAAVAIYEATVQWDGANNYIEVPYTTVQGPLGQTSPDYPISTSTSDYLVHIKGATVTKKTQLDLSAQGEYAFIGEVTGSGTGTTPSTFDITAQNILALAFGSFSLDGGYDGPGGSGSGRKITVDSGAMELNAGAGGTGDEFGAYLRVINDDKDYEVGLDVIGRIQDNSYTDGSAANIISRREWDGNVNESGAQFAQTGVSTLGSGNAEITLPAGTYSNLYEQICVIRVSSSPGQVDDGVYVVRGVVGNIVTVLNQDGTSPSFSGGSATYEAFLITTIIGGLFPCDDGGIQRYTNAMSIFHDPTHQANRAALRITDPEGASGSRIMLGVGGNPSISPANDNFRLYSDGSISTSGSISAGQNIVSSAGNVEGGLVIARTGHVPDVNQGAYLGIGGSAFRELHLGGQTYTTGQGTTQPNINIGEGAAGSAHKSIGIDANTEYDHIRLNTFGRKVWHATALPSGSTGSLSGNTWEATNFNVNLSTAGVSESCMVKLTGATPSSWDGWYAIESLIFGAYRQVRLQSLDGTNPTFPAQSGVEAEFYSGVFLGSIPHGTLTAGDSPHALQIAAHPAAVGGPAAPAIKITGPSSAAGASPSENVIEYDRDPYNSGEYAGLEVDAVWYSTVGFNTFGTGRVFNTWAPHVDATVDLGLSSLGWDEAWFWHWMHPNNPSSVTDSENVAYFDALSTFRRTNWIMDHEYVYMAQNLNWTGSQYAYHNASTYAAWMYITAGGFNIYAGAGQGAQSDIRNFSTKNWSLAADSINSSPAEWLGDSTFRGDNLDERGVASVDAHTSLTSGTLNFGNGVNFKSYLNPKPSSVTLTQDQAGGAPTFTPIVVQIKTSGFTFYVNFNSITTAGDKYWWGRYNCFN